jgi:hypothetical protein
MVTSPRVNARRQPSAVSTSSHVVRALKSSPGEIPSVVPARDSGANGLGVAGAATGRSSRVRTRAWNRSRSSAVIVGMVAGVRR